MDSFEINKIAGATLSALLLAMGLSVIGQLIFAHGPLLKPGYDLPVPTEAPSRRRGRRRGGRGPIGRTPRQGRCLQGSGQHQSLPGRHNFEKGAGAKVGPIFMASSIAPKAQSRGFAYSDGMKAKGGDWTFDDLDHFLTNPKAYVSGTKMAFAGEADPQKRADIIDYLHTLAENPVPLPAVAKEAAPAAAPEAKEPAK